MSEAIVHRAKVVALKAPSVALVLFHSDHKSAQECSSCRIASLCSSKSQNSEFEASIPPHMRSCVDIGKEVDISAPPVMQRRAVFYLLLVPLIVMIAAAAGASALGGGDSVVALSSIAALVLTLSILYCLKSHINRKPMWTIIRSY